MSKMMKMKQIIIFNNNFCRIIINSNFNKCNNQESKIRTLIIKI